MIKNISGILALVIGLCTFGFNYYIAVDTYPKTPIYATRILYYGCFISQSLLFFALSFGAKTKIKQLIYYAGSNFYLFLTITYLSDQFLGILIKQNKIIATLILTITSCIIYYLFSSKS